MNHHTWQRNQLSMPLFISVTAGVFMLITLTLLALDFYPEPVLSTSPDSNETKDVTTTESDTLVSTYVPEVAETPVRIEIPTIGVNTIILSPQNTDVDVLDRALQSGAVRYPGSGMLGEATNMLIFGHSSYLPVVHNKAYQAFNELGTLQPGDSIKIYSDTRVYDYAVVTIEQAKAQEVLVSFNATEPMLTLSTCNTFGAKEDRWIVTAKRTDI